MVGYTKLRTLGKCPLEVREVKNILGHSYPTDESAPLR